MTLLWQPTPARVADTLLTRFTHSAERTHDLNLPDYAALHRWSIDHRDQFWTLLWDFCGVIGERGPTVIERDGQMPGARFFPDSQLNFAENLLRRRDDGEAIVFRGEPGAVRRMSWAELHDAVHRVAEGLRASGVQAGDRIGAIVPNIPEAVVCMLAAAALGATWSSCSPDFGAQGILDRFDQIAPTLLFAVDGYFYNGKLNDIRDKVADIRAALPSVRELVVIPFADCGPVRGGTALADFERKPSSPDLDYVRLPFNHPLYILYSSGTTGKPKCIVHGAGGTLLQHLKEHQLHADVRPDDRLFYFTTCGWMMWNWLASALASQATLMLYDGSPFHPDGYTLFDYCAAERFTQLGVSAKFIQGIEKFEVTPAARYSFPALRTVLSTGSVLLPEGFDYVYRHIKQDVCLSSVSGGTDIISCFIGGNPNGPVYRGELQAAGLGMATEVYTADGRPVTGEKGELVCSRAFPSMPIGFWGDDGDRKYRAAYFERFPNVWAHGDFAEVTPHQGFVIYGRSDATLNPGGVRIGTAEIYRQVEKLPEVVESVAIGQDWDGDVRVVLFVVLKPGATLDAGLEARLRQQIKVGASPRHVPARILQVTDIPRTRSGKLTELAIRDIVHGQPVKNAEALANPEALDQFRNRPELAQ